MYKEDDLLPISALQHFQFCQRQCALIHIEQLWEENLFTAEGRVMHERVHDEDCFESRPGVRVERGLSLRSLRLGLIGKADVVEFHSSPNGQAWTPFPVEYKRGKAKSDNCDRVQLCAQALCLEEMLGVSIPKGALFYGKIRRRLEVVFDLGLRQVTEELTVRLHELFRCGKTPGAVYTDKCERCSLVHLCLPRQTDGMQDIAAYIRAGTY